MRSIFWVLLLALSVAYVNTLVLYTASGDQNAFGGGGWIGEDEYENTTDPDFPKESINPDEEQQKRLVVEWGKASMGYMDYDSGAATWKDDDSLRPDREICIRGKLLKQSVDGSNRQSVDWFQGIRVIVARFPDVKHDWSRRQERRDAVWDECEIDSNGEFLVRFSPGELCRSVGKETQFQVGLSLGHKVGQTITWRNTFGVLPQSVTMLSIPGPPPINESMQIINGAPSYSQKDFNPAKLIRAVNHLIPMGKEKAIGELREFMKIARSDGLGRETRFDENIDTSDNNCVFLIVHLLFEPTYPNEPLPEIMTIPFSPEPDKADAALWPLHPVHLQDDVPFFLVCSGDMAGRPDSPYRHIDWAEEHGKIRTTPYRPLDNPMLAAQRMVALPQTQRLYEDRFLPDAKDLFYQQAWNIIVDTDPKILKAVPQSRGIKRVNWDKHLSSAARLSIHWSEAEQRYIMP